MTQNEKDRKTLKKYLTFQISHRDKSRAMLGKQNAGGGQYQYGNLAGLVSFPMRRQCQIVTDQSCRCIGLTIYRF